MSEFYAKKRIVHLNITLQVIQAEDYNKDEENDTRLMNVSIISTNIESYYKYQMSLTEDFMYPDVFTVFLLTLRGLSISVHYNDIQIDGNVILSSYCFQNNTLVMNTTECKKYFSYVSLQNLYYIDEDGTNSAVNLFFYNRNLILNSLFYDGTTKSYIVKVLKYIHNIKKIYIYYNNDDKVSVKDVINLVNSSYIKVISIKPMKKNEISADNINSINDDFFKNNINLEELSLVSNNFTEIPKGIKFLRKLKRLEITQMVNPNFNLSNINLNLCQDLQFINFSFAYEIPTLNKQILPQVTNLKHLHFESCGIKIISPDTFASLKLLETINLSFNKLKSLDTNIFKNLASSSTINLNYNFFKYGHVRLNLSNVQKLYIKNCNITNPAIIIEGDIKYVDLSHNEIINWNSSDIFVSKNHRIRHLKLYCNNISTVNLVMGKSMDKLESIRMYYNPFDCSSCSLIEFRNWVLRNKTDIIFHPNNWIPCEKPENIRYKNKTIFNVQFNPLCMPLTPVIKIGLPVSSLIMFVIIVSLILYAFRFDMSYISHLWTVKNNISSKQKQLEECIFDAYVSYSVNDKNWVLQTLIHELESGNESEKYKLCLHERDGELGIEIMENIFTCMEKSRHVILVLSTNFLQCGVCNWTLLQSQLQRVKENKLDFLMIIELENLNRNLLPLNLRLLMGTRTYLEWPKRDSLHNSMIAFWTRLRQALGPPLVIDESQFDQDEEEVQESDEDLTFNL